MPESKSRKREHPTDDCKTSFLFKIKARRIVAQSKSTDVTLTGLEIENTTLMKVQQSSKSSTHLNELIKDSGPFLGIYGKTIDKELIRKLTKVASDSRIERCATVNLMVKSDIIQELESLALDDAEDEKCVICLENLNLDDTVNLPCYHHYHEKCFLGWLRKKQDCPICRHPLTYESRL